MTDLAKLVVKLEAQTAQYMKELDRANARAEKFAKQTGSALDRAEKRFASFGKSVKAGLAFLGAGLVFNQIVKATSEAEMAFAQLDAAVKSTGGAAGFTAPQLSEMASSLQKVTTFGDDAIMSMQSVLLTFTQISGPVFEKAQEAVLDLSARLGTDLKSSALLVGKALNDPVRGMNALRRSGVQLTSQQQDLVKSFVAQGNVVGAQGVLLEELQVQFGGAARAARDNFGGALAGVKNALGDLLEAKGGLPRATEELNKLADILADPAVKQAADTLFSAIITGAATAVRWVSEVVAGLSILAGNSGGDEIADLTTQIDDLNAAIERGKGWGTLWGVLSDDNVNALIEKRNALVEKQTKIIDNLGKKVATAAAVASGAPIVPPANPEAVANISEMIEKLEEQIAIYGKSAGEVMRYRIEQGDLMDQFMAAGPAAGALKSQLISLAEQYERLQKTSKDNSKEMERATEQLKSMEADLAQQIATLDAGAVATLQYKIETGDLAATFAAAGPAAEGYKQKLLDLTKQLEDAKVAQEKANEQKEYMDQLDKRANEIREDIGRPQEERDNPALREYRDLIAELNELVARGKLNQDEYNAAIDQAEQAFKKANDKGKDFMEQASRNVQDILAQYLEDPFGKSLDNMVADFGKMIMKMAAQAVAADIASKLFGSGGVGSGGGWLGKAASAIGGFFGGVRDQGGRGYPGQAYMIGTGAQPEMFIPDSPGTFIPAGAAGNVSVTNYFSISAPGGQISRATEQQIAARVGRSVSAASARNN